MSSKLAYQTKSEIRAAIMFDVIVGFDSSTEIVENIVSEFSAEARAGTLRRYAETWVERAINEYVDSQSDWPELTDDDRLDAAFAELEEQYGILAQQNCGCCLSCGHAALKAELDEARQLGRMLRGYVFYNIQDTWSVLGGGTLQLAFGTPESDSDMLSTGFKSVNDPTKAFSFTPEFTEKLRELCSFDEFTFEQMSAAIQRMVDEKPLDDRLARTDEPTTSELAAFKVANDILEVLDRHGLDATWEGHIDERIEVKIVWKKRC